VGKEEAAGRILVVDDDENILKLISMRLRAKDYKVFTAVQSGDALNTVRGEAIDLALVDLKLGTENGIDLMKDLHKINPIMPVIILTAFGTIKTAVEAMKKGAYSYLTKPFDDHELLTQIENCLDTSKFSLEVKKLTDMVKERYGFENIIGKSDKMKRVLEQVAQAAETGSIIHIEGESGTGKELIARALHVASSRRDGPFVAINCAAIPEMLLESELFGYEKGAFTGAFRSKKGLFVEANKGTFFLDEISEMPLSMQPKLLRVLEELEVFPLGAGKPIRVDARVIVASNKNLDEEVKEGRFREDLFYRIHVIPIKLPPLRERIEDIPLLAEHFLKIYTKRMNKGIKGFSGPTMQELVRRPWPGNVRELENAVQYAVTMSEQDVITEDLIPQTKNMGEERLKSLKDARDDFERNYLIRLVRLTRGNVSQAAKLAGKYRADFYELLRKHNLNPEEFRIKGGE